MNLHLKILVACLLPLQVISGQVTHFEYDVDASRPDIDVIGIRLHVKGFHDTAAVFCMPAWAPGDYILSDFGQWVLDLKAFNQNDEAVPVVREGMNRWRIHAARDLAVIEYRVRDIPEDSTASLSTTTNEIQADFIYAAGNTLFGYLDGYRNQRFTVSYTLPAGWSLWCGLDSLGPNLYRADTYDHLVDCPVLAGGSVIKRYYFEVNNCRYDFLVNSDWEISMDSLMAYTRQSIEYQTNLFQETPFERYGFILNFYTHGYHFGAMEHENSSVYFLQPPVHLKDLRTSFYPLVLTHEFFHVWNPKRFKPNTLMPVHYQDSVKMKVMWFVEGFTEYYAKLTMVRAGVWPAAHFYNEMSMLAQQHHADNLEALSLQAARIGVAPTMYSQGALIAFMMDLYCRDKTDGAKSMDDVMIYLNKKFGRKNKSYNEEDLLDLMEKATGVDFGDLYKKHVRGKKSVKPKKLLSKAGLIFEERFSTFYGWNFDVDESNQLVVTTISDNSTATRLGLRVGDIITSVQGMPITDDMDSIRNVLARIDRLGVGDPITFEVERNGKIKKLKGKIRAHRQSDAVIREDPNADPRALHIRKGLFGLP